jgi:hypothetical protein
MRYAADVFHSGARQFATEAIAQNDNTVPDGLVCRERRYAERRKDKRIFGKCLTALPFAQPDIGLEQKVIHATCRNPSHLEHYSF